MAFSIQRAVSDGTMTLLPVSIKYFDRDDITVYFDDVPNAFPWVWVGTTERVISFTPPVPTGVTVKLQRNTDISQPRHIFTLGAQFTAQSVDEDFKQVLQIAQEAKEGGWGEATSELRGDLAGVAVGQGASLIGYADVPAGTNTSVKAELDSIRSPTTAILDPTDYVITPRTSGTAKLSLSSIAAWVTQTFLGYVPNGASAVQRTVQGKLRESVSVLDFGAVADGVTDNSTAFAAARSFIAATGAELVFPAGNYSYSVSPNWAITNGVITCDGEVHLIYTGTGNAVIMDAGPLAGDLCYNLTFGGTHKFHIDVPATAANSVYVRSVHHSEISLNIHSAGTVAGPTTAALWVEFAVCTEFNVTVSGNEGGWYLGAVPLVGLFLTERLAGETVSYCSFPNPVVEGPDIGIYLDKTLGNIFIGGTSEGCPTYGVFANTTANWDRFIGTDFEVNTVADIYCQGTGLEFISCDSYNQVTIGGSANRCVISGGGYENITLDTGSDSCSISNVTYNRRSTGGVITDAGNNSFLSNVVNAATNARYLEGSVAFAPGSIAVGNVAAATVVVQGAKLGDRAVASFSLGAINLSMSAQVTSAGLVTVYFVNNITGAPVDPGSGTVFVTVFRR